MASAFTHGFVGFALGEAMFPEKMPKRFRLLMPAAAILPDIDAVGHMLGVEYASSWGHRGLVHSIAFAALIALGITALFFRAPEFNRRRWKLIVCFFLAAVSHGVLDAMTTGGLGVAFFSPFDTTRYFLPWRPIRVSPIGVGSFFSAWGVRVIVSELLWVWLPVAAALLLVKVLRRGRAAGAV